MEPPRSANPAAGNETLAESNKGRPAHIPVAQEEEVPYSVFTKHQKLWISLATSLAAMFSTMSSYIYFPALVAIADDLGVSLSLVNLTITSYLIVAGVAPSFMGDLADNSGRRPVYILMFSLMIGANIGIALQKSYPALLVLRMVQSAGSSGLYGIAYGVIADIAHAKERGTYVGILLTMTDVALSFGPVIGGGIAETLGWRWIFWFLVIFTGSHFVAVLLFVPETQRKIVGDGRARVRTAIYRSLFPLFQSAETRRDRPEALTPSHRFPNPLTSLGILRSKGSLLVIAITTVNYAVKMTLQTSLGAQCIELYDLTFLQGGLIYLASGVGSGVGSFVTGRFIVDRIYRTTVEHLRQDGSTFSESSPEFPLERTRLKGMYVLVAATSLGTAGYGAVLMTRTHISAMLVMQFITGASTASSFAMCGTLLTDLNTDRSATAQAASNLVRCLSAGAAIAALQPLVSSVGPGWCFGVYACVVLLQAPMVVALERRGRRWRGAVK